MPILSACGGWTNRYPLINLGVLYVLPVSHLTSIFVKVSASDVAANSVAPEIIAPLLDANGAFSFGSEELLDETADAIVAWIVPSKSRSRKPPALSASVE